jgi:hypothetical protein
MIGTMFSPQRFAVIPTRDRPQELGECVTSLRDQGDHIIVVSNGADETLFPPDVLVVNDDEQPPNLSRLWNHGMDMAAHHAGVVESGRWEVGVFNDDTVTPAGWWDAVSTAMQLTGAAAGCSDPFGRLTAPQVKTVPDSDIYGRMTGWAFMLRGEAGLRADERLRWWFGDTDLDWAARAVGGMVMVPGFPVANSRANSTTVGVLAEQAGRDRETFTTIHGWAPW